MTDENYGLKFDHPVTQLELALYCFRNGYGPEKGFLGRFGQFKNIV